MLRSATFNSYADNCLHIEQLLDLCLRALYNGNYPSAFLTTGVASDGSALKSLQVNHWAGSRVIDDNLIEEQTVGTFVAKINTAHKNSVTPWLEIQPIGDPGKTPNGIFA